MLIKQVSNLIVCAINKRETISCRNINNLRWFDVQTAHQIELITLFASNLLYNSSNQYNQKSFCDAITGNWLARDFTVLYSHVRGYSNSPVFLTVSSTDG